MRSLHTFTRLSRSLAPLLAMIFVAVLAGCGGGNSNSSSPTLAPPAAPLSVSATLPDGLTATLSESAAAIPTGGNITYTLTLTNNTTQSITLETFGGFAVGGKLTILDSANNIIYGGVTSGAVPAPSGSVILTPGQSVAQSYNNVAVFAASGKDTATATFTPYIGSPATPQTTTVGPLTVTVQ